MILGMRRGVSLLDAHVTVTNGNAGWPIGLFKSKLFSLGGGFHVLDEAEQPVAEIKGDWKGWNFRFLTPDGTEIGKVTKKWAGIGKELFTSADNYMISKTRTVRFGLTPRPCCWRPDWPSIRSTKRSSRAAALAQWHVVDCPRCGAQMEEATFDAHLGRRAAIDICHVCHSFWFDTHESATLTPGATLKLFRIIGEKIARPERSNADLAKCPRCKSRLRRTHDIQRTTKFEYLSCPHAHGRLTTFFDFLREKDFIRPLTPQQIEDLGRNVGSVNCANCGAPVDVTSGATWATAVRRCRCSI